MAFKEHHKYLIVLLIVLSFILASCTNSTPTPGPNNIPYYPGCSEVNLVTAVGQANVNPGPDEIHLEANCVYTLTTVANTSQVDGITISNGLPEITEKLKIYGNGAQIEIVPASDETLFGHITIAPGVDLNIYDLTLEGGVRPVGGAVVNNGGDFFASNVNFFNNITFPLDTGVTARGGAIFSINGKVHLLNNSALMENRAGENMMSGVNYGGAVYAKDSALIITNSNFFNNFAAGDGGAVFTEKTAANSGGGMVIISGSDFFENSAEQNGGALAVVNEVEGVLIGDTSFRRGEAGDYGGAVYSEGTEVSGNYVSYIFNSAEYGGAVYSKSTGEEHSSAYKDENSEYITNTGHEIGGAIFSENSDLYLNDCVIATNQANYCGGIRNGGSPSVDWDAGEIGIGTWPPSTSRIIDSDFSGNDALAGSGGGICHKLGDLLVRNSIFSSNYAFEGGAGIIIQDQAEIVGSHFYNNKAFYGGAVLIGMPYRDRVPENQYDYNDPEYMTFFTKISTSIFASNTADKSGGGIYAHHRGVTNITHSLFQNNTSNVGGGIARVFGKMYINNSTFSANSASRGGAIRAVDISGARLGIKHSTLAFNVATETSNGGEYYNVHWGGGALNAGYHTTVENSLIYQNLPMDCQLTNGSNYSASNTYDSDGTCSTLTEPSPHISPLLYHGGATKTHALLPFSPLIDILPGCAGMVDDQREVARPKGTNCDPGAYEFDPDNPPEEWLFEEYLYTPDQDDSSDNCDPFAGMEVSLLTLGLPEDTMQLPVVLRVDGEIPRLNPESLNGSPLYVYNAQLGDYQAYKCGPQGFPDRLYCMFQMPPGSPGLALDFTLFLNECEDPVYFQPLVSIPEPQSGGDSCRVDLNAEDCKEAGGSYQKVGRAGTTYECVCP